MSTSLGEQKYFGNPLWMWFIRATMFVTWIVGTWAIRTLLSIDKNQALTTYALTSLAQRVDKIESHSEQRDKEERDRLYQERNKGVHKP